MKSERSTEHRDVDWGKLIETSLTAPGSMGNTYNRFKPGGYSFGNQLMLLMQGVQEPVNSYKRWQAMGRQVLRGSKAFSIMVPLTYKDVDDHGQDVRRIRGFKLAPYVFGVSQTTGDDLPAVDPPGWSLETALDTLDITEVPFRLLDGNVQGYSVGREIAINPVATDPLGTTYHELGHIVLGHTEPARLEEYGAHRGLMEFQAEATSYLTMHELDVLSEEQACESRAYIQGWLRSERPSDVSIRQVFSATDTVLKAGRPTSEPDR